VPNVDGQMKSAEPVVTEMTGQKKNRCFSYAAYVELLADGT
jgi:hypothetical protein